MTATIFDTETTSIDSPEIVEAAWLEVGSPQDLSITNMFLRRYKPSKHIQLGAMAVHHIMDEDLEGCPPSAAFALPEGVQYLIGHNVDFDWKAAGSPPVRRICTLALSRFLWPQLDSHSQGAVLYHLEREVARECLREAHSAFADVKNCWLILGHIVQGLELRNERVETWEELWQISEKARIPLVAPFGKYKGQLVETIPRQYVQWASKQPDFDPYFLKAMKETI